MKIGELAKKTELGIETIRFYEKEGLIENTPRNPQSNYREYNESIILRLKFIKNAKDLGFSLSEIKELLRLKSTPGGKCQSIKKRAQQKLDSIENKITQLNQMKETLENLVSNCDENLPTSDCPILDAMDGESK